MGILLKITTGLIIAILLIIVYASYLAPLGALGTLIGIVIAYISGETWRRLILQRQSLE